MESGTTSDPTHALSFPFNRTARQSLHSWTDCLALPAIFAPFGNSRPARIPSTAQGPAPPIRHNALCQSAHLARPGDFRSSACCGLFSICHAPTQILPISNRVHEPVPPMRHTCQQPEGNGCMMRWGGTNTTNCRWHVRNTYCTEAVCHSHWNHLPFPWGSRCAYSNLSAPQRSLRSAARAPLPPTVRPSSRHRNRM